MAASRAIAIACAAALAALGPACGSSGGTRAATGPKAKPKLPPVKPEALTQFDAGLRALRLAGDNPTPDALEKAAERFAAATEIDEKVWEAWHNLGAVYFAQGADGRAAEAFSRALAINPAHAPSLLSRAEALRRAGRAKDARKSYRVFLDGIDDTSDAFRSGSVRLASLLREKGAYEDAVDVLREALRTAGANAPLYVELGLVYLAQGRDDLCALVLSKAAEIDQQLPSIYNARALLSLEQGKAQQAFEQFDRATALDPSYIDARFNKASVLLDAGDYQRAKPELDAVLAASPDDLAAQVALGVAHRGLGHHPRAKAIWEKVMARAPRSSRERGDAIYNIAILHIDFLFEDKAGAAMLDRFLNESPSDHPKRAEAEERRKELGL